MSTRDDPMQETMVATDIEQETAALAEVSESSLAALWHRLVEHLEVLAWVRRELDEGDDPSPERLSRLMEILMANAHTTRHRVLRELDPDPVP